MNGKKMLIVALTCLSLAAAAIAEEMVSSPSLEQPTIQVVIRTPTPAPGTTAAPAASVAPTAAAEENTVSLVIREVELDKMPESTAKLFQQLQGLIPVAPTATAAPAVTATPAAGLLPGTSTSPAPSVSPGVSVSPSPSVTPEPTAAPTPAPVKVDITTIVPEDTVKQIVEKLPETSKVENLAVTEFIPMTVANYDTTIGDVQAQVVTTVKYRQEAVVTSLLGVWNGEEMVWFVPDVLIAEDGSLILNFTAEMLVMMQDCEPVLMIMTDLEAQAKAEAEAEAAATEEPIAVEAKPLDAALEMTGEETGIQTEEQTEEQIEEESEAQ